MFSYNKDNNRDAPDPNAPTVDQIQTKYWSVKANYEALERFCEGSQNSNVTKEWNRFKTTSEWIGTAQECEYITASDAEWHGTTIMASVKRCEKSIAEEMKKCQSMPWPEAREQRNGSSSHSDRRRPNSYSPSLAHTAPSFHADLSPRQKVIYANMFAPGRSRR